MSDSKKKNQEVEKPWSRVALDLLRGVPYESKEHRNEENEHSLSKNQFLDLIVKRLDEFESSKTKLKSIEDSLTLASAEKFDYSNFKEKYGKEMEILRKDLFQLRSRVFRKDENEQVDQLYHLNRAIDAFSFIMIKPFSFPALMAWIIFFVQMSAFFISVTNEVFVGMKDNYFLKAPPLRIIPLGVDPVMHISQGLSLFILIMVQESLWEAVTQLYFEFVDGTENKKLRRIIPNILRLLSGLAALFVTFILVLASDNPIDLFKDFTAMLFISSLDNIAFSLARMKVFGRYFQIFALKAEKKTESLKLSHKKKIKSKRDLKFFILKPWVNSIAVTVTLYTLWTKLILIPHFNGDYLCQSMYIQLDDNVNSELSAFTGIYDLLKGNEKRGTYPAYKENKQSLKHTGNKPLIIRFCSSLGYWVFVLERENHLDECNEDNILVRSPSAENQEKFNIFDVSSDEWEAKFEEDTFTFMEIDYPLVTCLDRDPVVDNFDISLLCSNVEVDERFNSFVSSRSWSNSFAMLNHSMNNSKVITSYHHPVYTSSDKQDLLLFTGTRWILTSTDGLFDLDSVDNLEYYFEEEFHAKWSKFKVSFISESVKANTPDDTMTPISIRWYSASPKVDNEVQTANVNKPLDTSLICTHCQGDSNPCFYEGICLADQTCHCTTGSTGTLCQIPPTSNGFCDEYFNTNEYNYDGGDCCANSCASSDDFICGRDKTRSFYLGYELCIPNSCTDCWRASDPLDNVANLNIFSLSLSENGLILALIDSISNTVRIYDNDGSKWIMRGTSIALPGNSKSYSVKVSGCDNNMNNENFLSPATVAIRSTYDVQIYDWDNEMGIWVESSGGYFRDFTKKTRDVSLHNNGNALGLMYVEGSFRLTHRTRHLNEWVDVINNTYQTYYSFYSMSESGNKIALGTSQSIFIHNVSGLVMNKTFDREVKSMSLSSDGEILAALLYYEGTEGIIMRYDLSNNYTFEEMGNDLRYNDYLESTLQITNNGLTIDLYSSRTNRLRVFTLINDVWKMIPNDIEGKSLSFSSGGTRLAMVKVNSPTSGGGVVVSDRHEHCQTGTTRVFFTFITDNAPDELSWEIFFQTSFGDKKILKQGGSYEAAGSMIVERLCIDDQLLVPPTGNMFDHYLAVKINDKGLDGLREPGSAGISLNGTVIWSVKSTDGYENIFPLHGDENYLNDSIGIKQWPRKYDSSVHVDCQLIGCESKYIGKVLYEYNTENKERFMEISADGSVFALGNRDADYVRIFKYNSSDGWIQYGSTITGSQPGSQFGHSVSLSADGSIVAIGAPAYNIEDVTKSGQVIVYHYNHTHGDWSSLGDVFTDTGLSYRLGWSISLSADGTVIAMTFNDIAKAVKCQAFVYKYNVMDDKWYQRRCISRDTEVIGERKNIILSGTGLVVAIAFLDDRFIQVFKYNEVENRWYQQGTDVRISTTYFGWQMSLSADGSVFVGACYANEPATIYHFNNEKKEWDFKGQAIEASNEGYFWDVALSSNGSVLVVTYANIIKVYIYDDRANLWVESLVSVPETHYSGLYPRLAISADALVIAAKEDESVTFFRFLKKERPISSCKANEDFFNFTVQPDRFPQDISWYLVENTRNDIIAGGRLPSSTEEEWTLNSLTYTKCLPKEKNIIFTFTIEDHFGDGICCDWGNGSFQVEWNFETVINSDNFLTKDSKCLPLSANASMHSIDIEFKSSQQVSWALFDSSYNETLMEGFSSISSEEGNTFNGCLPMLDCMIFAIFDPSGDGSTFTIRKEKSILYEQRDEKFSIKRVSIGNCKKRQCGIGYSLFEFEIGTNSFPQLLFWKLIDSNLTILASREQNEYTEKGKYNYFQKCVPSYDCLSLKLFEGDSKNTGTHYIVSLDGIVVQDGISDNFLTIIKLGENCNIFACSDGHSNFELDIRTLNTPEEFTWQLLDWNNLVLAKGGEDYIPLKVYFKYLCVFVEPPHCLTLELFDTAASSYPNEMLSVTWNGNIILNDFQLQGIQSKSSIMMCNKRCQDGHWFSISFITDLNPMEFSWNIIDSKGSILERGNNYSKPLSHYFFSKCIPDDCLSFQAFDAIGDGGTVFELTRDNAVFHKGKADKSFIDIPIPANKNCTSCPQGQELFDLDLYIRDRSSQFSWELVNVNNSIVSSGSQYGSWYANYTHHECLPVMTSNECLLLRFFVFTPYQPVDYTLFFGGKYIMKSETAKKNFDEILISGNCSIPVCPEGYNHIGVRLFTIECGSTSCPLKWSRVYSYPDPFSWNIVDFENRTLMTSGKQTTERQRYYYDRKCLPSNDCMKFQFNESPYSGGVIVRYYVNDQLIADIRKKSYNDNDNQVLLGNCPPS